jgi:hypothetical protein
MNFMKTILLIALSISSLAHAMEVPWRTRVAINELQGINKDLRPILAAAYQSYIDYERCVFTQKQPCEKTLAESQIAAQERDEACKESFRELQEAIMRIATTNYLIEKNTKILSDAFLNK